MRVALVAAAIAIAVVAGAAQAQQHDDQSVLRALWNSPGTISGAFSDSSLRQLPIAQVTGIINDLNARCGDLHSVVASAQPGRFLLGTARCEIPVAVRRDHDGQIVGLWFSSPARRGVPLHEVLDAIERFDGSVSYAVLQDGNLIAGHAQNKPFAVGSAFKLIVLAALLEHIDAEQAAWSDIVSLSSRHISLPSGRLRKIPPSSPITLHTLGGFHDRGKRQYGGRHVDGVHR